MSILIDRDVEEAALLLQRNFPASKLVSIASAVGQLAPALWGRHGRDQVAPVAIVAVISPVETAPEVSSR